MARRLLALLLLVVWFVPAAAVGAVALHLALDPHDAAPGRGLDAVAAWTHGHEHPEGEAEHDHAAAISAAPALRFGTLESRRAVAESSVACARAETHGGYPFAVRVVPEPPTLAHGPDLLSLLSLLRL
jgi:hypothetical protein